MRNDDMDDGNDDVDEDLFGYYYELELLDMGEEDEKEYRWTEFSHYRYEHKTQWSDLEETDWDIFIESLPT